MNQICFHVARGLLILIELKHRNKDDGVKKCAWNQVDWWCLIVVDAGSSSRSTQRNAFVYSSAWIRFLLRPSLQPWKCTLKCARRHDPDCMINIHFKADPDDHSHMFSLRCLSLIHLAIVRALRHETVWEVSALQTLQVRHMRRSLSETISYSIDHKSLSLWRHMEL